MVDYEMIRELVKNKRQGLKNKLLTIKAFEHPTSQDKHDIENIELILKQSDTDLAVIYENTVQARYDRQLFRVTPPVNVKLRTDIQARLERMRVENEELLNRLEHWLYPVTYIVTEEEQEEAIKYLQSAEYQRAKQALVARP